jgi:lipid-A-disaccharide synthase
MRLLVSAGESSGERYGAGLIAALRRRQPEIECFGMGGAAMRAAGCETLVDAAEVSVVGITEVAGHLPRLYAAYRRLLQAGEERRPQAAVLIDFPDFHFRLARRLSRSNIPVIYFVSPQLWAWRSGRIRLVRRYVKKMLVIFPFEEKFYREQGVEAEFVGHPLADEARPALDRAAFAAAHDLDAQKPWIALLPGSRRREVLLNLPPMLEAAGRLGGAYQYILPVAPALEPQWLAARLGGRSGVVTLVKDAAAALGHARAAVVASGTATVEAALAGTPFVMVYRVSPLTWMLGRPLVKLERFAMVNLIAGREVVPELVQKDFTAENVARELGRLLEEGPEREKMVAGLAEVRERLRHPNAGVGALERAAEAVLQAVESGPVSIQEA